MRRGSRSCWAPGTVTDAQASVLPLETTDCMLRKLERPTSSISATAGRLGISRNMVYRPLWKAERLHLGGKHRLLR